MERSMKKNAVLMVAKTLLSLIIPLVTFPYISRVLQVNAIGQYNFANSIVSYFLLISGLGISTYAIREGAKVRENREKISKFASEMYLLNWISTGVSYVFLILALFLVTKLRNYNTLVLILSIQIIFTTFGRAWIYNVFEDFSFMTIVQVLFQFISIVALFLFVHAPDDLNVYAFINVVSATGSNILYGWHARKYVDIHTVKIATLKKHVKPILIIFSTSVATTIYVNSDMTILGWIVDDKSVGLYSTAVKIYNIVKQIFVAVITVSIPRLTLLSGTEKFKMLFAKVLNMLLFLALPAVTGLFILSDNVILIIAGEGYLPAGVALKWLSIALIFALVGCLCGMSVLLPHGKEKIFFVSTVISAVVNIVANFVLIPAYKQNAAAFTTALSQFIAFVICFKYSKNHTDLKLSYQSIVGTLAGCTGVFASCMLVKTLVHDVFTETILCILVSGGIYLIINLVAKNSALSETIDSLIKIIKRRKVK